MTEDIYKWLETAGQKQDFEKVRLAFDLVSEELRELREAIVSEPRESVSKEFVDCLWVLTNLAYFYGLSIEEIEKSIKEVSNSNWSKFCKSEPEATETVIAYKAGTHPSKLGEKIDCYYLKKGYFWIVYRKDGKILKSIKFKP